MKINKKKIDFLCVGAQKAGTTPLFDVLNEHTEIKLAQRKEVHFFDRDSNYEKGLDWYFDHFDFEDNKKVGEITPDYLFYNYVPERIKTSLGTDLKILIILRNPVLRTYSQYNFYRLKGVEFNKSFTASLVSLDTLALNETPFETWYKPAYYVERSMYYNQVNRYYETFGKENVHVVCYESFFQKGVVDLDEWNKLLQFLDIKHEVPKQKEASNVSYVPVKGLKGIVLDFIRKNKWLLKPFKALIPLEKYKKIRTDAVSGLQEKPPRLDDETKKVLFGKYFKKDVQKLEELTGMNFDVWRK